MNSKEKISLWFEERTRFLSLKLFLSKKTVPLHKHSFWYLFGGLSLFFFLIQLLTGMLLLLYYSPTPSTANESVRFIMNEVSFGWLIRSIHSWSANLMIGTVLIHLFSVYFMKAYRRPREVMWFSGVLLLFLVLGFGFTGYLLPWDTTAYFATQVGTEIPKSVPVIGEFVVSLLRGGEFVADESLKRLFALHVTILPICFFAIAFFHLMLNQIHGSSTPIRTDQGGPSLPFYPNFLLRDGIAWLSGLFILLTLALIFPVHIGAKADLFASAPSGIKPEWYFLPLFESLRLVPAQVFFLSGELVVNVCVLLLGVGIVIVPLADRNANRNKPSPVFTWIGIVGLTYFVLTIFLAYMT